MDLASTNCQRPLIFQIKTFKSATPANPEEFEKETRMKRFLKKAVIRLVFALVIVPGWVAVHAQRWTEAKANAWYAQQPWLVGSDYIPANAINQLEMWQAETFDPQQIDKELGWAEDLGMNTMRVFLHDLLWQQDAAGFKQRIDQFLTIAARHHIRPLFVLLDSCWEPDPKLGPQHPPIPGVHNSGWVQSPGEPALKDPSQYPRLKEYVHSVVGAFANDNRVLGWDLWNEPAGTAEVIALLPQVFTWAREAHPSQPLTSGTFQQNFAPFGAEKQSPITQIQLAQSDVISFHNYSWPEDFEKYVTGLEQYNRPILCTEYMARSAGSTFDTILPVAKKHRVAAINWGFVTGKTQTNLPWDSWERPYLKSPPTVWFHDVLHADGTPYREREVDIIRSLTGKSDSRN
jgi:Cellulase (glycosyl hydrolase family 5)